MAEPIRTPKAAQPAMLAATLLAPCLALGAGVFPGKTWQWKKPREVGLDATMLRKLAAYARGRGCVTRHGYMVFAWGDHTRRGDVASAAKPWYSHFLFKALELGKIASLDERVVKYEPRLANLNPRLGHKDRLITWRHLANQISCYGITERPGTAFDYNDWQMALFWDLLFLKIYGATYQDVDAKVLRPLLADPLQCQDKPTFMAFGTRDRPGRLAVSPRDFCRFGLLYLHEGNWRGAQLLERKLARMAVSSPLPNSIPRARGKAAEMIPGQRSHGSTRIPDNQCDHLGSYSWLWWTNGVDRQSRRHWPHVPPDAYGCFGHGGKRAMVVIPSLDIVLSWNDTRIVGREMEDKALGLVVQAVKAEGAQAGKPVPPEEGGARTAGKPVPPGKRELGGPGRPVPPIHREGGHVSVGGASLPRVAHAGKAVLPGKRTARIWPGADWPKASPAEVGLDEARLRQARDYALKGDGSGMIIRRGRLVMAWGDPKRLYDLKSTTKSIGSLALGLALLDGKIHSLHEAASRYHPALGQGKDANAPGDWLERITLFHLATHTAGFAKPGGSAKLLFEPGTKWSYSDSGPNWLAECLTLLYRRDLRDLLFERVFAPIGIQPSDLRWRTNAYRPTLIRGIVRREFGSGVSANVDAMARIGYLMLHEGRWRGKQLLPKGFVRACATTPKAIRGLPVLDPKRYGNASSHYGLLWWNNSDGTLRGVPRDAFWSWGLYDSLIVVIPSLEIVVARAGRSFVGGWSGHYEKLLPFLGPVCAAVRDKATPCPPSPVIERIEWDPPEKIIRLAKGSDNWPLTWADDDSLYAAYGDGWGFEPRVPHKLSLGLARILGDPPRIRGINVRSPSAEQRGDGPRGKKASGMLMAGGVLYMWARNADHNGRSAQLAWSRDHGRTWTWADWKFTTTFGCPTFLQFGKNYRGARDRFVYVYSHDSPSAYEPADRMVLARVVKDKIADRRAYEFFAGLDEAGKPLWTRDIARRGAVFTNPGRCYRSGVSYDAGIRRYLWCQTLPGGDTRFRGGLAIFDAPEPWGPWTTAFYAERWDVGPGETASFPPKWMSADGKTLHLVFSGNDCFSVRRARVILRPRSTRGGP